MLKQRTCTRAGLSAFYFFLYSISGQEPTAYLNIITNYLNIIIDCLYILVNMSYDVRLQQFNCVKSTKLFITFT